MWAVIDETAPAFACNDAPAGMIGMSTSILSFAGTLLSLANALPASADPPGGTEYKLADTAAPVVFVSLIRPPRRSVAVGVVGTVNKGAATASSTVGEKKFEYEMVTADPYGAT